MEYLRFIFSSIISGIINISNRGKEHKFKNVLLIRLDHIGDMMLTFPAINQIRNEFKDAVITLITGEWNKDLFFNSPLIDDIIFYNSHVFTRGKKAVTKFKIRKKILHDLRLKKVDLIIGFRDDLFTNILSLLLYPKFRRDRGTIRIKFKLNSIMNKLKFHKENISWHEIETNNNIVLPLIRKTALGGNYFKLTSMEMVWFDDFLKNHNLIRNQYAVIHPGASWEYKRWKSDNFRLIGEYLFEKYGLRSVLIGSADEKQLGEKIISLDNNIYVDLIGRCSLRESIILIINSKIAVCNDSSPMHIASQSGVPTIGIMGPGDINKFGPRGDKVIVYHKKVECYPCSQIICKYPDLPCVDLNSVNEVKTGIDQFLLLF